MATVDEAARTGTHRELLVAMRDRIAVAVTDLDTSPRDLAALTRRLQDIAKDIEAIDAQGEQEASNGEVQDGEFDPETV